MEIPRRGSRHSQPRKSWALCLKPPSGRDVEESQAPSQAAVPPPQEFWCNEVSREQEEGQWVILRKKTKNSLHTGFAVVECKCRVGKRIRETYLSALVVDCTARCAVRTWLLVTAWRSAFCDALRSPGRLSRGRGGLAGDCPWRCARVSEGR